MVLYSIRYYLVIAFIRTYKWVELQILNLFPATVLKIVNQKLESIGVIYDVPGKSLSTEDDEMRILSNCDYDKVVHLRAHKYSVTNRIVNLGGLGLGEAYMDGHWDFTESPEDITELATRVLTNKNVYQFVYNPWNKFLDYLEFELLNKQTGSMGLEGIEIQYELGTDLFQNMLDPWMQYSCGYWAKANNLNDAQLHKMDLIARKLDLKPGMRVLDMDCGWGTLCKYLAENYGVTCVGVSVSKQGILFGSKICEGLPVDFRLMDYRDLKEKFDRIVSIGMLEKVGHKNYRSFMNIAHECLKDDGIFLLHCIGIDQPRVPRVDPWLSKWIFPTTTLPRLQQIFSSIQGLFVSEDLHNFGPDYVRTLRAWRENFIRNWPKLEKMHGPRFYRMWIFYLSTMAAAFKARTAHVYQLVLSKEGLKREYRTAR